ncbi:MAG: 50S ribosomal protein L10 [Chloroflexota bacterium]
MAITKERKQALIAQYRELLQRSIGVILADYSGLTVRDLEDMRRKARELGAELHVVQNRLAKLAFKQAGLPVPEEALVGTTAIGFASDDALALAKMIVEAGKQSEFVRLKGGVVDGQLYDARQVEALAELPPLPVLRARLLALVQAPASRVAGALADSVRQLVSVVKAYSEAGASA